MLFNGILVIVSNTLCEEWNISKRHKVKRINKKWNKRYSVLQTCIKSGDSYLVNDMYGGKNLIVDPKTYKIIKKQLQLKII